jgi:hypothetical protein
MNKIIKIAELAFLGTVLLIVGFWVGHVNGLNCRQYVSTVPNGARLERVVHGQEFNPVTGETNLPVRLAVFSWTEGRDGKLIPPLKTVVIKDYYDDLILNEWVRLGVVHEP